MAVCLQGLSEQERVDLTLAMRDTGNVRNWDLSGPAIDKHSTGGIGDNVSLVLAPMLAACGAYVPMVSGRGLGHTGGTLDKLESIPGYRTQISGDKFEQVVADVGCAIVSAGEGIAPADKRLYAIRDLTGTVESIDLITSSILSKKLAAGLQSLVLDFKVDVKWDPTCWVSQIGKGLKVCGLSHPVSRSISETDSSQQIWFFAWKFCHTKFTSFWNPWISIVVLGGFIRSGL